MLIMLKFWFIQALPPITRSLAWNTYNHQMNNLTYLYTSLSCTSWSSCRIALSKGSRWLELVPMCWPRTSDLRMEVNSLKVSRCCRWMIRGLNVSYNITQRPSRNALKHSSLVVVDKFSTFFDLKQKTLRSHAVWPDWAIYWTSGNFLKPLATINLPQSPSFLGNFCKGVKINQFSCEIIFGQLL